MYVCMISRGSNGTNTVYSYGLDGTLASSSVLVGDSRQDEYRGLLLSGDQTLFAANANKDDSHISHYSNCDSQGQRTFINDFIPTIDPTLQHPYGLACGVDGASKEWTLYVTNQDDNTITTYNSKGKYIASIYDFGDYNIRGLAYDSLTSILYIAVEGENTVYAYDTITQYFNKSMNIDVSVPIGLYLDPISHILYIGSNDASTPAVYSWSLSSLAWVQKYAHSSLQHPAGMVVYDKIVYVLSQDTLSLLTFHESSGAFIGTLVDNMPDTPGQALLSLPLPLLCLSLSLSLSVSLSMYICLCSCACMV